MAQIDHLTNLLEVRSIRVAPPAGHGKDFQLPEKPEPGTLQVFRNGMKAEEGTNRDYVLDENTITVRFPLFAGRTTLAFKYSFRKR